jgi:uncharacterized protein (DUF885 family)
VTDLSPASLSRWQGLEDAWRARLGRIEASALKERGDRLTLGVLREALESAVALRVCRQELWDVNSYQAGWQSTYTDLARLQPVGTPQRRDQALARARALPRYVDQVTENLREGSRRGYSAPKAIVRAVVAQLDDLLATPVAQSPFAAPAERDPDPVFVRELQSVIADSLHPAIRRHREYLAGEYLAKAREALGVSANPDGAACYRAAVRSFSTLDLEPEALHTLGRVEMERVQAEMNALAQRGFGTSDVPGLLARLRGDRQYTFRSAPEVVAYAQAALDRAAAAMPRAFGILTRATVVIEPYPEFRQRAGAPGQYQNPPQDGSRPGVFNINTWEPERKGRTGVEAITFHETYPGHHLQLGIAREHGAGHTLVRHLYNSGFGEGWALYAERVADELGLYSSDVDRMGLLGSEAWRAARVVVDTGIHTRGMSRDEAVAYLRSHTSVPDRVIEGEVNRYISWPGQAPTYTIGAVEIRRLREQARQALGERFDVRAFHDRVLEDGNVTLPMLRAKIQGWIAER